MNKKLKKHHHREETDRKVSWLELFFDLSLVVPIFQLSHYLAHNLSLTGIISYVVLLMAVLQVWMNNVYYNEQFSLHEKANRVITLATILLLICMTAFIPTALEAGKIGFVISFCALKIIIISLWEWSAYHHPSFQTLTRRFSVGSIISVFLFLISLWLPSDWTLSLWVGAILLDMIVPAIVMKGSGHEELSRSDHLPERFGLLFLILLGESIISITTALMNPEHSFLHLLLPAMLGLLLVFGIWWLYIDTIMEKPIDRESSEKAIIWQQGHMLLFLALPALGASILLLLENGNSFKYEILIATVLAILLLSLGLIEQGLKKNKTNPCQKISGSLFRIISIIVLFVLLFIPISWALWKVFLILNGIVWWQVLVAERMEQVDQK